MQKKLHAVIKILINRCFVECVGRYENFTIWITSTFSMTSETAVRSLSKLKMLTNHPVGTRVQHRHCSSDTAIFFYRNGHRIRFELAVNSSNDNHWFHCFTSRPKTEFFTCTVQLKRDVVSKCLHNGKLIKITCHWRSIHG